MRSKKVEPGTRAFCTSCRNLRPRSGCSGTPIAALLGARAVVLGWRAGWNDLHARIQGVALFLPCSVGALAERLTGQPQGTT
jgi:hypothetical protein